MASRIGKKLLLSHVPVFMMAVIPLSWGVLGNSTLREAAGPLSIMVFKSKEGLIRLHSKYREDLAYSNVFTSILSEGIFYFSCNVQQILIGNYHTLHLVQFTTSDFLHFIDVSAKS